MNSTWLITSELANQRARKVLITCKVYTKFYYYWGEEYIKDSLHLARKHAHIIFFGVLTFVLFKHAGSYIRYVLYSYLFSYFKKKTSRKKLICYLPG